MMNWGLIDLYAIDKAPPAARAEIAGQVDRIMVDRGFKCFPEFDRFLRQLYASRPRGMALEKLYPQILDWFERQDHSLSSEKTGAA